MIHEGPVLLAPDDPAQWARWREELAEFRRAAQARLHYDPHLYEHEAYHWVRSSFACCLAMLFDQRLYDPQAGCWRVDSFLDEGRQRFGGYDSVVFWHAYPRIGIDDRNQFDFYRDMPGGLTGLRELSRQFHQRQVRVFLDYNPWDRSTRREGLALDGQGEPCPDEQVMAELVRAIEADGVFLDTMPSASRAFRAALDGVRPGLVLESEMALPLEHVADHHMSWGQNFKDSPVPGVVRNKWFERRHMVHMVDRFNRDHTAELHTAWMNGTGMMVWENVFGTWMGWCPRDSSILRAMLPIQRRYANLFNGEGWTPLTPTCQSGFYASRWEGRGLRLWTLVNRTDRLLEGPMLPVEQVDGERYFDLIAGREAPASRADGRTVLRGSVRPRGIAAFVALPPSEQTPRFFEFLREQAQLDQRADWSTTAPARVDARVTPPSTAPALRDPPEDMVAIPARSWLLTVAYRDRECGFYRDPPMQPLTPCVFDQIDVALRFNLPIFGSSADGRPHQTIVAQRMAQVKRYAFDLTPVTNRQYAEFLAAGGYRPRHPENFLKHWRDGRPPAGLEDHPVVYVDLEDARAYAAWAGKRLPTEEEWQLAAQGTDQRLYPWGNQWREDRCNAAGPGTTSVRAFPLGRSACGCYDMCGNTWEWTESQRNDGSTRYCILKGGSHYHAGGSGGSDWYADGGPRYCNFAAKFILLWPGLDRCATISFRCACDLTEP